MELDLPDTIDTWNEHVDPGHLKSMARHVWGPDAVAMAAGHYAAMRLFQNYGRAQTLAFFEDCIQTAEICDEILAQLDDEFV